MILTVTAGKGGVGKSTVAYNLTAELDGVVIDADLGMADLPAGRGPDLHDVLAGRAKPLEAVRADTPVSILPCGRSLAGARAADPMALLETVQCLDAEYDYVVIDSPAGMRSDVGLPLLVADACLLVTRPSKPALADALRVRELARTIETPLARVVLNRVDPTRVPGEDRRTRRIESTLGAPVTALPTSQSLARAQRNGLPVRAVAPESLATRQFQSLATAIDSEVRLDTSHQL